MEEKCLQIIHKFYSTKYGLHKPYLVRWFVLRVKLIFETWCNFAWTCFYVKGFSYSNHIINFFVYFQNIKNELTSNYHQSFAIFAHHLFQYMAKTRTSWVLGRQYKLRQPFYFFAKPKCSAIVLLLKDTIQQKSICFVVFHKRSQISIILKINYLFLYN